MARAGVAAAEAAGVAGEEVRLLRRDAGTFRIGDALVGAQGGAFAAPRQLGSTFGVNVPAVEQVQVQRSLLLGGQVVKRAMS